MIEEWGPLRPQNAQLVQGESNAVFNMRPDVLVFSWTDWSGGEGQFTFDAQAPGRYHSGRAIDGFSRPGSLVAGPAVERTKDSGGTNPLTLVSTIVAMQPTLVLHGDNLRLVSATDIYTWDTTNKRWGAPVDIAGFTEATGSARDADADNSNLYLSAFANIVRWDGTTFTTFATDHIITASGLIELGQYVYHFSLGNAGPTTDYGIEVREYLKSSATPVTGTLIYSAPGYGNNINFPNGVYPKRMIAEAPNRIYFATVQGMSTVIHQIIPSTAAGAGSGSPIAMLPAQGLSLVWSGGLLYLHANLLGVDTTEQEGHGVLMYVNPEDGTYGVVDRVRPFGFSKGSLANGSTQRDGASLLENYWGLMVAESAGGTYKPELMVLDTVNGALHPWARAELGHSDTGPITLCRFRGEVFFAESLDAGSYILRTKKGFYEGDNCDPMVISPVWDYGLVDEKILSSIRVTCEAVPTDWTISVDYQLDESGSWVNAGSVAATAKGGTFTVTTDSSTKTFRQVRLRVTFVWAGTGDPTTTPVLLGVEARAQVTQKLKSWNLMLECQDDNDQAQGQSFTGAQKIDNIQAIAMSGGNAISFKNGMTSRLPGAYDEYDVVVDSARLSITKPGEGYALLRLVEVA